MCDSMHISKIIYTKVKENGRTLQQIRSKRYRKQNRLLPIWIWKQLKLRRKCAMCKKKFEHPLEIDHIIPLSLGGSNDITNLQALCHDCHTSKHAEKKVL